MAAASMVMRRNWEAIEEQRARHKRQANKQESQVVWGWEHAEVVWRWRNVEECRAWYDARRDDVCQSDECRIWYDERKDAVCPRVQNS